MNLKYEIPFEVNWTLEVKHRWYTIKWTDKEALQDFQREHITLREVLGFLEDVEENPTLIYFTDKGVKYVPVRNMCL